MSAMGTIGRPPNKDGKPVQCKCGYAWRWNGKGVFATCPRCHKQTRMEGTPTPALTIVDLQGGKH